MATNLRDPRSRAMAASFAVAVLMLVGKLAAYFITGSTAILSDAAESVVHLFATGIAAMGLWYSTQPANQRYPYGYGKATYFTAGLEGAFILSASVSIIVLAIRDLIAGPELEQLGVGLAFTATLGAINAALGIYLIRTGRKHDALVLVANGKHVLTDMWTSVGVVGGVTLVWLTGIEWIDPVVAMAVGLNILVTAFGLISEGYFGLMERANPEHTTKIRAILDDAVAEGLIASYHQLRHRKVSDELWVEVHLLMPGEATLAAAHARATTVERRLRDILPHGKMHVTSHIEPTAHHVDHPTDHASLKDPFAP